LLFHNRLLVLGDSKQNYLEVLNLEVANPADFELPLVPGTISLEAVDTSQPSPLDVADFRCEL